MKEITSREFLLKTSKYIKDIPFVVTKRGVPMFKVVPVGAEVKDIKNVATIPNVVTNKATNVATNKCIQEGCTRESREPGQLNIEKNGEKRFVCGLHVVDYVRMKGWKQI